MLSCVSFVVNPVNNLHMAADALIRERHVTDFTPLLDLYPVSAMPAVLCVSVHSGHGSHLAAMSRMVAPGTLWILRARLNSTSHGISTTR